jgi:hypothetical protein
VPPAHDGCGVATRGDRGRATRHFPLRCRLRVEENFMQRTATAFLWSLVMGLLTLGCPEKRVEKEEPAAAPAEEKAAVRDKSGADDKGVEDEHADEADEHGEEAKDDKKPPKRKRPDKKEQAGDEKDQGGW